MSPITKYVAILIGISKYKNYSDLPSAVNDVHYLAHTIQEYYDKIFIFINDENKKGFFNESYEEIFLTSSAENTKSKIKEIFNKNKEKDKTLYWIHFSGHGEEEENKWVFLQTEEACDTQEKLGLTWLFNTAQNSEVKRLILTVDACRTIKSGARAAGNRVDFGGTASGVADGEGLICFGACEPDGKAYTKEGEEIGKFTFDIVDSIIEHAESNPPRKNLSIANFYDLLKERHYNMVLDIKNGHSPLVSTLIAEEKKKAPFDVLFIGYKKDEKSLGKWDKDIIQHHRQILPADSLKDNKFFYKRPKILFWSTPSKIVGIHFYIDKNENKYIDANKFVDFLKNIRTEEIFVILNSPITNLDVQILIKKLAGVKKNITFYFWKNPINYFEDHLFKYFQIKDDNKIAIIEEKTKDISIKEHKAK